MMAAPASDGLSCDMGATSDPCGTVQPIPSWGNTGRIAGTGQAPDFSWQGTPSVTGTPAAAIQALPQTELAKPLSNEMLAAAANAAWKAQSSSAGGLPWSASDPITPADVAEWKAANPSAVPNVGDFISPAAPGGANTVPIGTPQSPAVQPGPNPTPGSGQQVDFGPNPNTPPPGLEAIPTAQQILGPLLNLMPDLKNFAVPSHSAECPKPSFQTFGKTYSFESQCPLIESNRAIIEAAMMLVFSIVATFIVLRA